MFSSNLLLSALAAGTIQVSAQTLSKPVAQPPFNWPTMSNQIHPNTASPQWEYNKWAWGLIPNICKHVAERENVSPYDIEVYDVRYADCGTRWVFCRHNQANMPWWDLFDRFGRVPVGARDHVRHIIAIPLANAITGYAYSGQGDVVFKGNVAAPGAASIWYHEIGHALDWQNGQYSTTQQWINAYNADSAVPVAYAQTNQAENFAENVIVAAYDNLVPGGLAAANPVPGYGQVWNQFNQVKTGMGDRLRKINGRRCNRKAGQLDTVVCMGPAARDSNACPGVSQFSARTAADAGKNGTAPAGFVEPEEEFFDTETGAVTSKSHSHA
ncbi:hypothetical protein QBC38DRAFT_542310 [Podospora fimiseda]|uniref:Conidiation-specific protein n=1 Tax=Podospora fimiseda TaxID=252190 RepID=A0AAN7BW29_9PEZI|nr:hypothetical protein QBC38DRAFT_542310 [Podospora fimiseda]